MKGIVNPFEPWRPTEVDVPPPLHAGRPWRPPSKTPARAEPEPPFAEPVETPSPKNPPKRPMTPKRQRAAPPSKPVAPLRADQKVVLGMFFVLGVLGLVGLGWLGGTHLPRVFLTLLAVAVGFTIGLWVAHRRGWYARLGWMAAGLALAGIAAWFVPTTGGVNLWSAYRQVDELHALPAGDVAGYVRGVPGRRELVSEFPTFAGDVTAAERAWFRRTVDAAIEDADGQMETNPHKALAALRQLSTELARLEHYALVQGELEAARRRALQTCEKAALEEVEELLGKKQFDAVAKRGAFWEGELLAEGGAIEAKVDSREQLLSKRRQALAARLETARKEINGMVEKDRFQAVAKFGIKLATNLSDEAKAVGMAKDVEDLCASCEVFGRLARQAEQR
jgi:hypothetical protein